MTKSKVMAAALLMALGLTRAPALRADDPREAYEQIAALVGEELSTPFTDPDDPGLYERRQRLKQLFAVVPPQYARAFRERLGDAPTADPLSQQFHHTLHPATIAELLGILDAIPAPAPPPAPVPVATPTPPLVWPTMPLPASAQARYEAALTKLEKLVDASNDDRKWRYKCWIAKLRMPGGDDRVIRWTSICPIGGAIGAAYIVGPCDVGTGLSQKDQTGLWNEIHGVPDVEAAAERYSLFTHLKADILVNEEMTSFPMENLRSTHDGVVLALDKLEKWADNPMGGSSAMPRAYVSIKDWIGARQVDSNSVYSCH
jgi:hypothetical protein